MFKEQVRFFKDESGEIVDWVVVTAILILATYATLKLIGNRLGDLLNQILQALQDIGR
jgi:hypothetical protein